MKGKKSNLCVFQSEYIDSPYYTVNFYSKKTTLINIFSYYLDQGMHLELGPSYFVILFCDTLKKSSISSDDLLISSVVNDLIISVVDDLLISS